MLIFLKASRIRGLSHEKFREIFLKAQPQVAARAGGVINNMLIFEHKFINACNDSLHAHICLGCAARLLKRRGVSGLPDLIVDLRLGQGQI